MIISVPAPHVMPVYGCRFHPTQLPGLALWLDASDVSTITTDGSSNVSDWLDKSGFGRHMAMSNAAARPAYITGAMNNRNAVRFVGKTMEYVGGTGSISTTVLIACKHNGGVDYWSNQPILAYGVNGENSVFEIVKPTGNSNWGWRTHNFDRYSSLPFTVNPITISFSMIRSGATYTGNLWIDRTVAIENQSRTNGTTPLSAGGVIRLGRSIITDTHYVNCDLYELLLYHGDMTAANRRRAELYLRDKWGLP